MFLPQDAGARYALLHPRLGVGEYSTSLYRERFSHLDYMWRADPAWLFDRDGGETARASGLVPRSFRHDSLSLRVG